MLRLSMLGWTQQEISEQLQELWPDAKGTSQQTIAELLPENGNSGLSASILQALKTGLAEREVAKGNGAPETGKPRTNISIQGLPRDDRTRSIGHRKSASAPGTESARAL
jgi:hypothetical protein